LPIADCGLVKVQKSKIKNQRSKQIKNRKSKIGNSLLPRKVLYVMNSASGGAALSTMGLMKGLCDYGIESCAVCHDAGNKEERERILEATNGQTIFTPLYWWNYKTRAAWWKRPLIELRQLQRTGLIRGAQNKVKEFAAQQKVDLIHTNTILNCEGAFAARKLGLPHVWHLREMLGDGNPFRLPLEGKAFGDYMKRNCSKLVANSHNAAKQVKDWLPQGILEVVPNGIDLTKFLEIQPKSESEKIIVAMVGNPTSHWKKHWLFIEAAALVDKSLPIEFRIYGHDPTKNGTIKNDDYVWDLHERVKKLGLKSSFRFVGFVDNPATIMSETDILLHPADQESFGRIVVEAMAAALPVIGVKGGGVGEIVVEGETGLLAQPDNAKELSLHIECLAKNVGLRKELGRKGRERAKEFYSLETHVANILSVYKKAMEIPLRG
jgi:glycosyltransferase involved in cell wall biosynthesis